MLQWKLFRIGFCNIRVRLLVALLFNYRWLLMIRVPINL